MTDKEAEAKRAKSSMTDGTSTDSLTLRIERVLAAPRMNVWRCWTEPELLKQWFCPKPWTVSEAKMDVRAGGECCIVMQSPEGDLMPNPGQYLEVVEGKRLVSTDAFIGDWKPSAAAPFMVAEILLEDDGEGRTKYTAMAHHWTAEQLASHKDGFMTGWNQAADQLEELAKTL